MTFLESFVLGIVQGLGEFLPISSSGHLVVVPWFMDFKDPGLSFDVALHFGTLFALIAYFWRDWVVILSGAKNLPMEVVRLFKRSAPTPAGSGSSHLFLLLIVSAIPGGVAGVFLDDWAETVFRHPLLVAFDMALMGAILLWADRRPLGNLEIKRVSYGKAFLIGCAQALALVPGVSRSGATITAALVGGLSRQGAARLSFLMATPITFGACLYKSRDFIEGGIGTPEVVGIITSAVVGFLAIWFLLRYVQQRSFAIFSYYRFLFAAVVTGWFFLR